MNRMSDTGAMAMDRTATTRSNAPGATPIRDPSLAPSRSALTVTIGGPGMVAHRWKGVILAGYLIVAGLRLRSYLPL